MENFALSFLFEINRQFLILAQCIAVTLPIITTVPKELVVRAKALQLFFRHFSPTNLSLLQNGNHPMVCSMSKTFSRFFLVAMCLAGTGCTSFWAQRHSMPVTPEGPPASASPPREKNMVSLPPYVIEPPDILMIQAIKVVPKPPHKIEPFDIILIRVEGTLPEQPIAEAYAVDPEGKVDLGPSYGRVSVVNLTADEAQDAIAKHLSKTLNTPQVSVSLAASAGAQQITGEHLVGMDGRVNLGTYGSVYLSGLTIEQAKAAIEEKLGEKLVDPEVVVDVFAYNSKVYYVITEGAGLGDNFQKFPITGSEHVLDAITNIGGLSQLSSKNIWIARPAPNGVGCAQILPVDYKAISRDGITATNYQLFPGDRLFIAEDSYTAFNSFVAKITQPWERILGFVSLGTATANRITRFGLGIN